MINLTVSAMLSVPSACAVVLPFTFTYPLLARNAVSHALTVVTIDIEVFSTYQECVWATLMIVVVLLVAIVVAIGVSGPEYNNDCDAFADLLGIYICKINTCV